MGTVVVLGSLNTDFVARASRFPLPGESLVGNDFTTFLGGKGVNQAVATARLGAQVTLIGRVGSDAFGDAFFPVLTHEGIESTYIERDSKQGTGSAVIIIAEDSGQNEIVVTPGANMAVSAGMVERALQEVQAKRTRPDEVVIFLAQCETSQVSYAKGLQLARELGMTTILNAAPIPREPLSDALLTLVDILVVNEIEAASVAQFPVTSVETAQTAAERLLERGPYHVLVTLGVQGCVWSTRAGEAITHRLLPAIPVQAVDATAAGDAFCGALAASLANGITMETALRRASVAGALTVTRKGAIAALPTVAEVEALLAQIQQ